MAIMHRKPDVWLVYRDMAVVAGVPFIDIIRGLHDYHFVKTPRSEFAF